jgi:hypothetical protein
MALDLVVLGLNGRPERCVRIGVEQHAELMNHANDLGLALLQRLQEYHEDALFSLDELPALAEELSKVEAAVGKVSDVAGVLQELLVLVTFARDQGKEIEALAD